MKKEGGWSLFRFFRLKYRISCFHDSLSEFVIPFWNTLSIFWGALIAWGIEKKAEEVSRKYTIPVASGMIAGESLMGVLMALFGTLGIMR